jgi:hypothetical protein
MEMRRIQAGRIVAEVEHAKPLRNRSDGKRVGKAMRLESGFVPYEETVTSSDFGPGPDSASSRSLYGSGFQDSSHIRFVSSHGFISSISK